MGGTVGELGRCLLRQHDRQPYRFVTAFSSLTAAPGTMVVRGGEALGAVRLDGEPQLQRVQCCIGREPQGVDGDVTIAPFESSLE